MPGKPLLASATSARVTQRQACSSVLLVERDLPERAAIEQALLREGLETLTARRLSEAQAALTSHSVCLILLSPRLAPEDGWQVFRQLRGAGLPLVVLVPDGAQDSMRLALALGADDCISDRASPAEIYPAMSAGVVPAGTTRLEPSGSVTVMSLMENRSRLRVCGWLLGSAFALRASARQTSQAVSSPAGWPKASLDEARPKGERSLVGTGRLELPTSCVSSRRSNQLSYAPIAWKHEPYRNDQSSREKGKGTRSLVPFP